MRRKSSITIAKIAGSSDTRLRYASKALELCGEDDLSAKARACYNIGKAHYMSDETSMALPYLVRASDLLGQTGERKEEALTYVAVGSCYEDLNNQDSIFYYYNKALKILIDLKDTVHISYAYLMIGQIHYNLELYSAAEENYQKALEYVAMSRDTLEMAYCRYLIGQSMLKNSDTLVMGAMDNLRESVCLFEGQETTDAYYIEGKYLAYTALSESYIKAANTTGRKEYADSCNIYIEKVGDYDLRNGNYTNYLNTCYIKEDYLLFHKRYREALEVLKGLEKYVTDELSACYLRNYHERLYEVYKLLGDYKTALVHLEKVDEYKFASLNDSTFNSMKNAEVERTRMIEELKRESAEKLHQAEINRFIIITISLVIGIALIFVVFWNKRKANKALSEKNKILNEQKDAIAAQRDEIESQRNDILMSINYAKLIQTATISTLAEVRELFPESFVYYRPKNIVSGDWYRVAKYGEYRILVVADCTGHGVPGAMLSMLGVSALKEILAEMCRGEQTPQPAEILNKMRKMIIDSLAKNDEDYHGEDGMDVAILVFTPDPRKVIFAGAKQDLYVVRDGVSTRTRGDSMPIGRFMKIRDFVQTEIELQDGDMIYLFSDGIKDQFGPKGKFSVRRQTEFMEVNATKTADEQLDILSRTMTEWRGEQKQTDDQTMIGVKVVI